MVNKIAAGEVIERPASVVKELLENSIDAGATRIDVTVEKGGQELIRISDDGCGMTADDLPLAVASHATSKLPNDEALFDVRTLGFRGEALASISAVSHLAIRSRTADSDGGSELLVRGGASEGPAPCGCPLGTVMEIRNLFFNTPVRRKFMRTPQTEMGHIVEAFTRIALANPQVHMTLSSGNRQLHDLPPTGNLRERIAAFFGGEIADSLIAVSSDDSQTQLSGYVCDPSVSRANNRMQYLFLNGRHIRDRSLQHALGEAYRGLLMVGRHPVCFLRLTLDPMQVDVNVHPTKLEVRFADGGKVYSQLLQTLRHKFLNTDLTARVRSGQRGEPLGPDPDAEALGISPRAADAHRQGVLDWARTGRDATGGSAARQLEGRIGGAAPFKPFPPTGPNSAFSPRVPRESELGQSAPPGQPARPDRGDADLDPGRSADVAPWDLPEDPPRAAAGEAGIDAVRVDPAETSPAASHLGFQVHNRYLVTQDDRGMVVVDQHALHERIMYERIREKVLGGGIETQSLLVPEPVSLTPAEASAALDAKELLAKVGIKIEPFGGDTILVSSYPAMLANLNPSDMVRQALESLIAAGKDPEIRDLLDHLLHTIACKAAIKAGDRLTPEEITSLLEQRDLYHDTHHCPHGRPTALFFSRDELDRMFGRMGPRG